MVLMKSGSLDRSSRINLILLIVLVGFVVSVFYHYVQTLYFDRPYPYTTPLFVPQDRFSDFSDLVDLNRNQNPYLGPGASPYYPLANQLFYLSGLLVSGMSAHTSFIPFAILAALIFGWFSFRYLRSDNLYEHVTRTIILTLLTYPFLFDIDRGNIEIFLFLLLLAFAFFFQRRRFLLSAAFLSLAVAMKLHPAILLLLYLPEKKYRALAVSVGLALGTTLLALLLFGGGFLANLKFLLAGANLHGPTGTLDSFLGNNNVVQRGVSLFTLAKVLLIETNLVGRVSVPSFLSVYVKVGLVALLPLGAYVVFVERTFWRKVAVLVLAMLLLPQLSADYKLLHLFVPLFLFVNEDEKSGADFAYALLFGLLLISKDYYFLPHTVAEGGRNEISIAVILNPILMLIMMSMIIVTGLHDWRRRRRDRETPALPASQVAIRPADHAVPECP